MLFAEAAQVVADCLFAARQAVLGSARGYLPRWNEGRPDSEQARWRFIIQGEIWSLIAGTVVAVLFVGMVSDGLFTKAEKLAAIMAAVLVAGIDILLIR